MPQINTISTFLQRHHQRGTISAPNAAGIGLAAITSFTGNLSNFGTITAKTGVNILAGVTFGGGAAIVNSGTISGSATALDVSSASSAVTIDQTAGLIAGAIKLSANADVLNISGGTICRQHRRQRQPGHDQFQSRRRHLHLRQRLRLQHHQSVNVNSGLVILDGGSNSATSVNIASGATLKWATR